MFIAFIRVFILEDTGTRRGGGGFSYTRSGAVLAYRIPFWVAMLDSPVIVLARDFTSPVVAR